jgi:hypothetical protein
MKTKTCVAAIAFVTAVFCLTAVSMAQPTLNIYPPHSAPSDMTRAEQDLHRRAVEVAIWAQPLMNYKAMFDALNKGVDMKTAAFICNVPSAGVSSLDKELRTNSDGTVDIYVGPKAPVSKEGNWIPTAEGKNFFIYVRFYGANDPIFTKEFQLNDLEEIR